MWIESVQPRLRPHPQRLRPAPNRRRLVRRGGRGGRLGRLAGRPRLRHRRHRSALPAFFNGVFGHKPSPGLVPNTGQFPNAEGEARGMLTLGPLARRAEDLMPVTADHRRPRRRRRVLRARVELGDPAGRRLRGAARARRRRRPRSSRPRSELRDARDRAADALRRPGRRVREQVSLQQLRRALEIYLAALGDGAGVSLGELLTDAGVELHGSRHWRRRRCAAAATTRLPVLHHRRSLERLNASYAGRPHPEARSRLPARRSREEIEGHPRRRRRAAPPAAPARGARATARTVGRAVGAHPAPRCSTCSACRSPQVPLGLNPKGLPLGVQVAAADGNDHLTIAAALALERRFGGWSPPA